VKRVLGREGLVGVCGWARGRERGDVGWDRKRRRGGWKERWSERTYTTKTTYVTSHLPYPSKWYLLANMRRHAVRKTWPKFICQRGNRAMEISGDESFTRASIAFLSGEA